jgi:tetratricopeptide (TPR) repeat protein
MKSFLPITFLILIVISAGAGLKRASGKNAVAYNNDGWGYLDRSENYKAIFSFKNALQKNPRYKDALLGLGRAYYNIDEFEMSVDLFGRVLKIDDSSDKAHVGMGLALSRMGKFSKALNFLNRAVELSEDNLGAKYGIAYLYYLMNKPSWAKRKLAGILRINPYHFDSILLMADLKVGDNRMNEARELVEKAISINSKVPDGHVKLGEILFRDYMVTENEDSLKEAREALGNALSITRDNYQANRIMGIMLLDQGNRNLSRDDYLGAISYFQKARKGIDRGNMLYNLAISYDRIGDKNASMEHFLKALKKSPFDSILIRRFEDFLIMRDYKIGHPARILLNREQYNLALNRMKKNFPDEVIFFLRRALLLNPMNKEAREHLISYYSALDYNRFYIEEIKGLMRFFPERKYRDRLSAAISKRRKMLYHIEGFSSGYPPRDVPRIFVMNFSSGGRISEHPDTGSVLGNMVTFAIGQFGRMVTTGIRERHPVAANLKSQGDYLGLSMEGLSDKIKKGRIKPVDLILYGDYREKGNRISANCRLMDYHNGIVLGQFTVTESGKEALSRLSLRIARKLYNMIPYRGRVLKLKEKGIIVNMGLYDGVKPGNRLVVYKYSNDPRQPKKIKRKLIFTVKNADTLISFAVPGKISDLGEIYSSDTVYPLKKRRAKRIE